MILVLGIDLTSRAYWWLDIGIVLYIIAYGYSFFVQRKPSRIEQVVDADARLRAAGRHPPAAARLPPLEIVRLRCKPHPARRAIVADRSASLLAR